MGVVVWGKSAEACGEYLKKGSPALVEGRLQSRSWETDKGEKRSILEVVAERVQFLGSGRREGGPGAGGAGAAGGGADYEGGAPSPVEAAGGADDDIPF